MKDGHLVRFGSPTIHIPQVNSYMALNNNLVYLVVIFIINGNINIIMTPKSQPKLNGYTSVSTTFQHPILYLFEVAEDVR